MIVIRIGTRAGIAIPAAGGLDHGVGAAPTAGREVEIRTELAVEAEAAAAIGGRMSEESEAGVAIGILRGDIGVGAEAGIGIGMTGGRLADIKGRYCNIALITAYELRIVLVFVLKYSRLSL